MAGTNHDGLRLNRRSALKALTLSAAALAAGSGVTDVIAAGKPTLGPHPDTSLVPIGALPTAATPPVPGTTYQMFAGTDFHARQDSAVTYSPYVGVSFAPGANDYFMMPIDLPKGSQITECECYFVNNSGITPFYVDMLFTDPSNNNRDFTNSKLSYTSGTGQQVHRIAPMTDPVPPFSLTVDPSRFGIQILAGNGGAAVLYGARIGYVAAREVNMLAAPIRLLETRLAYEDPSAGQTKPGRKINSNETWEVPITGQVMGGIQVPTGAKAVIGNVTVTGTLAGGYLTLFPQGGTRPNTSSINYGAGTTVANAVIVGLSGIGQLSIYAYAETDVIFDAVGYVM